MRTATFELSQSIPSRIKELLVLVDLAKLSVESDEELYNAVCRSTCVLMASHLEGFLKDLQKSIIDDLNYNVAQFSNLPPAIQRLFCLKIATYAGVLQETIEVRVEQLLSFFSKNSVPVDLSAFPYLENPNKNPSPKTVESAMERLGIPSVLSSIAIPAFEIVFNNNDRKNLRLNRELLKLTSKVYFFPFKNLPDPYFIEWKRLGKKAPQTLWHLFVEEIMMRRNTVAHGDTLENPTSWDELRRDAEKLRVLMYAILYSSAAFIANKTAS